MTIFLMLTMATAGAFVFRMRGGMKPSFPRPVDQVLFSLPFAAVVPCVWGWEVAAWLAPAVLVLTTLAVSSGHGRAFRLYEPMKPGAEPEKIEWPILWLEDRLPTYWYKVLIHVVSGLSYTLPAGIATLNPALALSGAFKGPAYMLSERAEAGTEGGELLTGAFLWGAVATSALAYVYGF